MKYGQEGGLIRMRYTTSPDRFVVSIWNEGPGFPSEERSRLFRKFSRLQSPELKARKGAGVGLYTAWRIAHLHGGRMDATSKHGHWAEVQPGDPAAASGVKRHAEVWMDRG